MPSTVKPSKTKFNLPPPATTPEARENQLVNLAIARAEEQLRNGTASSQVICHFLKLGSTRERVEQEFRMRQAENLSAKTTSLNEAKSTEQLYTNAIEAMKRYSGANRGETTYDEEL